VRVLVAPDSFGGTLSATAVATAVAEGWRRSRPGDEVAVQPLSDGGEGLVDVVAALEGASVQRFEVVGPRGLAHEARWVLLADGSAVVESAQACGLAHLAPDRRDPRRTTTWGVGQLLDAARRAGARRVLVGLGGSATVDGGAGALSGLGFRLTVDDGSGLKVGGEDLPRVTGADRGWVAHWDGVEVELLADVTTVLADAPRLFGPQKGADQATVEHLERGLAAWRRVCEDDLGAAPDLAEAPGSGAAGGLGYGLAAGIGARLVPGAGSVAGLVGLPAALVGADVVVTGEGRLDATSAAGKVVGHLRAAHPGRLLAVTGGPGDAPSDLVDDHEPAARGGERDADADDVAAAAARLAGRA